jgi:hypothetical protein
LLRRYPGVISARVGYTGSDLRGIMNLEGEFQEA